MHCFSFLDKHKLDAIKWSVYTPKKLCFPFFFLWFFVVNLKLWNPLSDLKRPLMILEPLFFSALTSLPKCRTGGGRYKRRTLFVCFSILFLLFRLFAVICVPGRSLLSTLWSPVDSQPIVPNVPALRASLLCRHGLSLTEGVCVVVTPPCDCWWWHLLGYGRVLTCDPGLGTSVLAYVLDRVSKNKTKRITLDLCSSSVNNVSTEQMSWGGRQREELD